MKKDLRHAQVLFQLITFFQWIILIRWYVVVAIFKIVIPSVKLQFAVYNFVIVIVWTGAATIPEPVINIECTQFINLIGIIGATCIGISVNFHLAGTAVIDRSGMKNDWMVVVLISSNENQFGSRLLNPIRELFFIPSADKRIIGTWSNCVFLKKRSYLWGEIGWEAR